MSFIPTQMQLHGLSLRQAELFGKPHIGASYLYDSVYANLLDYDAQCTVCGQRACNSHHVVPRRIKSWTLNTPLGSFKLLSPLFALCGSGTTGCHGEFHGGARYEVEWQWKSEQYQEEWWGGHTLSHICRPHDKFLFQQGFYLVKDKRLDKEFELRG